MFTSLQMKAFPHDCLSMSLINASSDYLFTCLMCLFCWYLCLVMLCPEIENTGRWSLISCMSNPQIISWFISFVNILSIKVADCWVILVGLSISGYNPLLYIVSINLADPTCYSYFSKSILKSPHINIDVFGLLSVNILPSDSMNISMFYPGVL